jgi:hypothetical protein
MFTKECATSEVFQDFSIFLTALLYIRVNIMTPHKY